MKVPVVILMLVCAPSLWATDDETDSVATAVDLGEIVVTGTNTPKSLKNTPVQTRLITAGELRRADATDIQGLLQQELPGVEFSYAMNQQTNMNLAGFSGRSVLILVDGERLAGETMDNVDFSRLNLGNVGRIEIVRGAASALYGSDAAGGVINLISKNAVTPFSLSLDARAGSHGEIRAGASVRNVAGCISNVAAVNFYRVGTYHVCLDAGDDCDFRQVYGYHTWNLSDRLSYKINENLSLTGRASYFFKERQYNPDIPDRYRDFSGGLKMKCRFSDVDLLDVSYAFDQYDKSDYNRAYRRDIRDYSNVQHSVKARYALDISPADNLVVGADWLRDWLDSYQFAGKQNHCQHVCDILGQYDRTIADGLEVIGALRWDWYSDGNTSHISPKISALYRLGDFAFRGGYASGFRAPTLKERYMSFNMADIFDIHGNPDLKSEKSHNFNLSVEFSRGIVYFNAGCNYNLVRDRIATSGIVYAADGTPYLQYINVSNMRVLSVDASFRSRLQCGLAFSLAYNFTRERTARDAVAQYCPARPHSLNARLTFARQLWPGRTTDISLSGRFLSRVSYSSMYMYEPFEVRQVVNPAYTLWTLRVSQEVCQDLSVVATVDNLLNYIPAVYSFNAPVTDGAAFSIGIKYDIN